MAAAARTGLGIKSIDLVVLPASSEKTVASRDKRKRLLRDYLREQLAAVSELPRVDSIRSSQASPSASSPSLDLESICAKCRGHCCRRGGDHAFISPRTLKRILATDAAIDGDALIDLYLSQVPERSYAGSCIYHSTSGCALPRALRSEVCMKYLCKGLEVLSDSVARYPERPVVGVFEHAGKPFRATAAAVLVRDGRVDPLRPERARKRKAQGTGARRSSPVK